MKACGEGKGSWRGTVGEKGGGDNMAGRGDEGLRGGEERGDEGCKGEGRGEERRGQMKHGVSGSKGRE